MKQIPLGTNVVVRSGKKVEVIQTALSAMAAVQSGKKINNTAESGNVADKIPWSHPFGRKDGLTLQISSKVRQSPVSVPMPESRSKEQCSSFAFGKFACAILAHENAFAIAASTFVFVFLVFFWAMSCLFRGGCGGIHEDTKHTRDRFKRQLTPIATLKRQLSPDCDTFTRQMSLEAEAVAVFARQCAPEATSSQIVDAYSTFKRSITPEAGGLSPTFKKSITPEVAAHSYSASEAYDAFERSVAPEPEGLANKWYSRVTLSQGEEDKWWRSWGTGR